MENNYIFYCHHMTINMGKVITADYKDQVGSEETIVIDQVGKLGANDLYAFFGTPKNLILPNPHITAAIKNGSGLKPFDSNKIKTKMNIDPIHVHGIITENTDQKGYCSVLLTKDSSKRLMKRIEDIIIKDS